MPRVFVVLAAMAVASQAVAAQQRLRSSRESDEEQTALQSVLLQAARKAVDDVAAGRPIANDLSAAWTHDDLLKAQNNQQFVPFTIRFDPSRIPEAKELAIYWRVVSAGQGGSPAYEYLNTVSPSDVQLGRVSRSFTVAAGTYDVYVVLRESNVTGGKTAAPSSIVRHTVTVPDLWNDELSTSSVIIADRIEALAAPLTPQQKIDRPYALKGLEFVPAMRSAFSKTDELSAFLLIYNAQADGVSKKPNVDVEFNFYAKLSGGEKFFNRTRPTNLNAETLPPQFDVDAGYQLQAGQAVPLASFPAGDYRLEIRVTDRIAKKTVTRAVNFTVTGS